MLEDHPDPALEWYKLGRMDFQIWLPQGGHYEPDFVIETADRKFLAELKARNEVDLPSVQYKAHAAALWCRHATEYETAHGGKTWLYVLIPHDVIVASASFGEIVARFTVPPLE